MDTGTSFSHSFDLGQDLGSIISMARPPGVERRDGAITYDGKPMKYDAKNDGFSIIVPPKK